MKPQRKYTDNRYNFNRFRGLLREIEEIMEKEEEITNCIKMQLNEEKTALSM